MVARCGNVVVNVLKCQGVEIVVVVVFVWGGDCWVVLPYSQRYSLLSIVSHTKLAGEKRPMKEEISIVEYRLDRAGGRGRK